LPQIPLPPLRQRDLWWRHPSALTRDPPERAVQPRCRTLRPLQKVFGCGKIPFADSAMCLSTSDHAIRCSHPGHKHSTFSHPHTARCAANSHTFPRQLQLCWLGCRVASPCSSRRAASSPLLPWVLSPRGPSSSRRSSLLIDCGGFSLARFAREATPPSSRSSPSFPCLQHIRRSPMKSAALQHFCSLSPSALVSNHGAGCLASRVSKIVYHAIRVRPFPGVPRSHGAAHPPVTTEGLLILAYCRALGGVRLLLSEVPLYAPTWHAPPFDRKPHSLRVQGSWKYPPPLPGPPRHWFRNKGPRIRV